MRDEVRELIDEVVDSMQRRIPCWGYPVDTGRMIRAIRHCRMLSYQKLAELSHCEAREIARYLKSADGCTHYARKTGNYLIAVNEDGRSAARIRWTVAHEVGHIAAGHFLEIDDNFLPNDRLMEEEANYFAASLLAPFEEIWKNRLRGAREISLYFGISAEAAEYRWREYLRSEWGKGQTVLRFGGAPDIRPEEGERCAL